MGRWLCAYHRRIPRRERLGASPWESGAAEGGETPSCDILPSTILTRRSASQVFESWEHGWEDDSGTPEKNFEEFEKVNQKSAQRVFQQLALLVQACSDADNLKKRYGLESNDTEKARKSGMTKDVSRYDFSTDKKFSKDAIETFKKSCHVNLTFFKKARFVMTD